MPFVTGYADNNTVGIYIGLCVITVAFLEREKAND